MASAPRGWITDVIGVITATYHNWRRTRTIRLGAGIAYYALFAVVPLVTLSLFIAQLLIDPLKVEQFFVDGAAQLGISPDATQELTDELGTVTVKRGLGFVGFASLIFAAGLVFMALQDAFDEIWEVPVVSGVGRSIRRRVGAFVIVGGGGVVVVVLLVVNSVTTILQSLIPGSDNLITKLGWLVGLLSSWVVLVLAIALVFQVLTRVRIRLIPLLIGSLATGGLLSVGTSLLGIYLSDHAGATFTGAAAGVLLTLIWLYYVAQMVLVGLHLTRVLHERCAGTADVQAGSV